MDVSGDGDGDVTVTDALPRRPCVERAYAGSACPGVLRASSSGPGHCVLLSKAQSALDNPHDIQALFGELALELI